MQKYVSLVAEKSHLISQRDELKGILREVESVRSSSFVAPNILANLAEDVKENAPACFLKKIKEFAQVLKKHLSSNFERGGFRTLEPTVETSEICPIYEAWEHDYLYEYIGGDITLVEFVEGVRHDFLAEAALLLKKKLEKLESRLRHVIRAYNRLMVDKRAYFRSIVKLMFKNMDDEHSTVNNSGQLNYLGYLHTTIRYGIRTHQETAGGFNRAAITG